ncbi:MAG TPA: hypothetical protein VGA99_05245 [bacterium]
MQIIQNVLSEQEFQNELIKRFFHPKSYFFRCINHELESLLDGKSNSNSDAYLIFGSLLDKLVASENKIEFLQTIARIDGFEDYLRLLNEGVQQLRDSELDCERMKIKIEGLAQQLFQSAMLALSAANTKAKVKNLLGLESVDMPLDFNLDEVAAKENLEPPLNSQAEAEPLTLDELPGLMEEETDFLLNLDAGRDADSEGGCESEFPDRGGSDNFCDSRPATPSYITSEPASVIAVFEKQLRTQLDEWHQLLTGDVVQVATWQSVEKILDDIAAISMIYGFEAFEQLAMKSRKVIPVVLANIDEFSEAAQKLMFEVREDLVFLLASEIDHVDEKVVKQLSEKLLDPEKTLREMKAKAGKRENGSNGSGGEGAGDTTEAEPVSTEMSDFMLPGEDDDELMLLIKEISDSERERKNGGENRGEKNGEFGLFKQQAEPHFDTIGHALDTLRLQPASSRALEDLQTASKSLLGLSLKFNLLPLSYYPASVESLVRNIRVNNAPLSENERFLIEDLYKNVFSLSRMEEIHARESQEILNLIQDLNSAMQMRTHDYKQHPDGFILPDSGIIASA